MTTGERIKVIRKDQRMSQSEFAKEIAVSTTTVCQLEVGKYNVSRSTKHIICTRFRVNPEWLDTGEGEMYLSADSSEDIVPELVEILNDNKSLFRAVKYATRMFDENDWKKLNAFIASLGEDEECNQSVSECEKSEESTD